MSGGVGRWRPRGRQDDQGTAPFQSPTIRDDPDLSAELGRRVAKLDDFPQKQSLLDDNAKLAAFIGPASAAVIEGEKQISKDFTTEVEGRQALIDELWVGKKALEMTFKRDRALIKFIFFDFSKDESGSGEQRPGGRTAIPAERKIPSPPDAAAPLSFAKFA